MFRVRLLLLVFFQVITWSLAAQHQDQRIAEYKTKIIGVWVSESDATYKIEFTTDVLQKEYIDNELQNETASYSIGKSCGLNQDNGFDIFLVRNVQGQDLHCEVINNLYLENKNLYFF